MEHEERGRLAFWVHQVIEYLVGGFVFVQGVQSPDPLVPALAGLVILVVAASAQAPLSAFKVVPRPVHRVVDVVVVTALVLLAATGWGGLETTGRVLLGIAAVCMAVLVWRTDYRRPTKRTWRVSRTATERATPAADASATAAAADAPAAEPDAPAATEPALVEEPDPTPPKAPPTTTKKPSGGEALGRAAGRAVGQGVNALRKRKG